MSVGNNLHRKSACAAAVLALSMAAAAHAQHRLLIFPQLDYTVSAGGSVALDASPDTLAFIRSARTRSARSAGGPFALAPELNGSRAMLGVPLSTAPGDYTVSLSVMSPRLEQRTATVRVTVKPFAQPDTTSAVPPVVLLDGLQLSLDGSCPIPQDSTGTFGNLQAYLQAAPNHVPTVYFFENCTECPQCSIERLGAQLATFLNSLPVPQVDVVAHSMGGLIVRSYLSGKQSAMGSFRPPPTVKIRKAVFLATPHFGSPLADEVNTNVLFSDLYGNDPQIQEMERGSQFEWDLATWNQFGDDLRGVDAVAAIGNAGPMQQSDGVVDLTSGSLDFVLPGRTRVVPYCHISSTDVGGLAGALTGCNAAGIAYIDSPSHPSFQIVSSFLMGGTSWESAGTSPSQDPILSTQGGMIVVQVTAAGQYVQTLQSVTWGATALTNGAAAGELFFNDFVPAGTATFSLTAAGSNAVACGPYTQTAGRYSAVRCKAAPAISSVDPLVAGTAKSVAAGGNIVIAGIGFGAQQCGACGVTASGQALHISGWSDTAIMAALPANLTGFQSLALTTASGADSVGVMIAPGSTTPALTIGAVVSSASGLAGPFAPGELISIYGAGLGPVSGVPFAVDPATGGVDTTLGGTRVLFGSVAAPILYASAGQINAVVPYEMAGQSQAAMQVQYGSGAASQTVQIASAAPGIFTLDASGSGQAVAVNLDGGTVNGSANPAAKGSYVTVYFTGGGQTSPAGVTGSVTGAVLKWLAQSISVTVGNQPAIVQFDGAAPTFVDGLIQLNIQLSPNTPSGDQPVAITVGGVTSPVTATVAVK
ncbi:MAG TPA: IPT/TIG domain-containing protein [Bryobacteraceae bacterium]|jgi:uncharacterized protein (TIGR03437 family)|nr:IPT/TIG domain-containing protein [Bryobacteraceae bacterium]